MYRTFYITYSTFLWVNAIFTHAIMEQLRPQAQLLVSNIVIDSLWRSLYPHVAGPFLWDRGPTDPALQACPVGEPAEREESQTSSTESDFVPAASHLHGAPGGREKSSAIAATGTTSCEGEEGGWKAHRCGPASAASGWQGSQRRLCCSLATAAACK